MDEEKPGHHRREMRYPTRERTVITTETLQRTVVYSQRSGSRAWCEQCRADVSMYTPDEAAALARTTTRAIYRQLEKGDLHFVETDGDLLICSDSLRSETPLKALSSGGAQCL